MAIHILTARQVQTAGVGDLGDGGGLFLRVSERGSSWVFRYTAPDGRRREMGLGRAERATLDNCGKTLVSARKRADEARDLLADFRDPLDERRSARRDREASVRVKKAAAKAEQATLSRVAREYHERVIEPQRSAKHGAEWISSLERLMPGELWDAPIASVTPQALLEELAKLQARVPVTASRVRQRLEVIFDEAEFNGLCKLNPARLVRRKLAQRPKARTKGKFAELPYSELPSFVRALRQQAGTAARALEFALLTAARTGEVIGATPQEIEAQGTVWRIPGARMKGKQEHLVYLSQRAREIVAEAFEQQGTFLFPSPWDSKKPLSNMAMLTLLKRMGFSAKTTVHGLCRSTFSTWANETGAARPDVIEACLAHKEQDRIRAAYNRAQFNAERRQLLLAWESFCSGQEVPSAAAGGMIVPFAAAVHAAPRAA